MRIKAWRLPAQRCLRLFTAMATLAFFSTAASAQTAEQIAAQKLMTEKLQQQILQSQTSPPPPAGTTTTTSPPPSSTDTTTNTTTSTPDVPKLPSPTSSPSPTQTTTVVVAPAPAPAWTLLSGAAKDVGSGGSGLWVVGTNVTTHGYGLWRWVNGTWASVASTGATRIDVDAAGVAWTVDNRGIVQRNGTAWTQVGTGASDIGVGPDNAVWTIGNLAEGANFGIYRYNAATLAWTKMPGYAVRVDVDPQGNAWVVNAGGAVYRWNGSAWTSVAGVSARDIGIGGDGSVFVTGADNAIYRWSGTAWVKREGAGVSISVSPTGVPVVVNGANQIYTGWK